jgi:transcriptional regulator with XRE-family HTH domain
MKNAYDPIDALTANVERLVRTELKLSNREAAERFEIAEGSVQNFVAGQHNKTLKNLAQLAHASRVPMWQLFLESMPENSGQRAELDRLIAAFLSLESKQRELIVGQAEYYRDRAQTPHAAEGVSSRDQTQESTGRPRRRAP